MNLSLTAPKLQSTIALLGPLAILLGSLSLPSQILARQSLADSPVDRSESLKRLPIELGMADGSLFDGAHLIIPDVKNRKLVRYHVKQQKLLNVEGLEARVSATYFNHGIRWIADNGAGSIATLKGNQLKTFAPFATWNPSTPAGTEVKQRNKRVYRPNDLVVDNQGGIYVTFTPQGKVIYIAPDATQSIALDNLDTPNGIILAPDQSTLYVSSFVPKKIHAFAIKQPGDIGEKLWTANMNEGPDRGADGMTVDRAGNVYCAGPKAIWIWNAAGKLIDKIACPSKPINCVFGDADLRTLYITGPGGVYQQRMLISGVAPQTGVLASDPMAESESRMKQGLPSTRINDDQVAHAHLDTVYASWGDRKMLVDILVPKETKVPAPCVVLVHGGGWHKGDKKKFRAMALEFCRRGYVAAAIEYRLADEAAFPAAIHDCFAAVRFLRKHADDYSLDPKRIVAVGGSAGGHLVGLMAAGANDPKLLPDYLNEHSAALQASVVMAGPMQIASGPVAEKSKDLTRFSNARSWMRGSIDEQRERYELADALNHFDRETCPILFAVGELDDPQRNQPSRDRLNELGVRTELKVYPQGKHGCWNRNPWLNNMTADMDLFFQSVFK